MGHFEVEFTVSDVHEAGTNDKVTFGLNFPNGKKSARRSIEARLDDEVYVDFRCDSRHSYFIADDGYGHPTHIEIEKDGSDELGLSAIVVTAPDKTEFVWPGGSDDELERIDIPNGEHSPGADRELGNHVTLPLSARPGTGPQATRPQRRNKPITERSRMQICTIGDAGHGKSTLTAALSRLLASENGHKVVPYATLNEAPKQPAANPFNNLKGAEYGTARRDYNHLDGPSHPDIVHRMVRGYGSQTHCAILVIAATNGVSPMARKHLNLARDADVPHIVVFLNKCDLTDDLEIEDLNEAEIRDLLDECDLPGDEIPIFRGSALQALQGDSAAEADIRALADALEELPIPD